MSNRSLVGRDDFQTIQLMWTLGLIGALWSVSDLGYYFLLPALGSSGSYSAEPSVIALYYAIWVVIAIALLKPCFKGWRPFENGRFAYVLLSLSLGTFVLFAAYVLPHLPQVNWNRDGMVFSAEVRRNSFSATSYRGLGARLVSSAMQPAQDIRLLHHLVRRNARSSGFRRSARALRGPVHGRGICIWLPFSVLPAAGTGRRGT